MRSEDLIISPSGIRGVVGKGMTPDIAARYGAAVAACLQEVSSGDSSSDDSVRRNVVFIGRDSRPSGELLVDAVAAGVRSVGLNVIDLGIVPTPTGLLAIGDAEDAAGGILVTASHNPVEWNGLKLVARDGRFLGPAAGRDIQARFGGEIDYAGQLSLGGRGGRTGACEEHVERILGLPMLDRELIASRRFYVALDCVRGAGGLVVPSLLERLGCRVSAINLEPDGRFPRPPEPVPENLGDLGALVRESHANVGFAVDPDVDRLALVDEKGRSVGEDWTLALAVELLADKTKGPVVANLSTSRSVQEAAERAGATFAYAPVGEANVVRRMMDLKAWVGGEGNGGVILPSLQYTRDAPLACALTLQFLARQDEPLSEIIRNRARYQIIKRKISRGELDVPTAISAIRGAASGDSECNLEDGIRLDWPDGSWVHARPSGTEPIFRIMAEAPTRSSAEERADWVEAVVRGRV